MKQFQLHETKIGEVTSGQPRKNYSKKDQVRVEKNPTFPKPGSNGERCFNLMNPTEWWVFCFLKQEVRRPFVESIRTEYRS